MNARHSDGSAGDADYGTIGRDYATYRRPDPVIAAHLETALGGARRVLNVGAGTGSYEPQSRDVTAVEPSASMRKQRPAELANAIDATAEDLPFEDARFDACMATFTIHQWSDLGKGLAEMRRVTGGPVLILTCDPSRLDRFWLNQYAPEVIATEARRYPSIETIVNGLDCRTKIVPITITLECTDGFNEAYYGRPERLLEAGARLSNSAWSFVEAAVGERFVEEFGRDLADGLWDVRHGHLRNQPFFDGSLRLIVGIGS